ncbi:hypothetical protein [Bdellovibrio sp. HCB337]|uniref:hypothetical protein n=1 Tax=Bdellovibrio sp. HCB337 TaxID=3394358 RepID=UPI0039A40BA2
MGPQKTIKNLVKAGVLLSTAGLMMGNQSCEQKAAPQRELKRIVEMGKITAPSITLPQGGSFDFQYVANQQVYGVLQKSEHFALRYAPPVVEVPTTNANGDTKFFNVTTNDKVMMKAFASNSGASEKPQYSKDAECLINLPNARIAGSVNAFEMIGGAGVQIGFNAAGPIDVSGLTGLGFSIEWAQLALSMMATHPLTNGLLAGGNVTSNQTKTKVNFTLDVGAFSVGPSAYYQTPLAKVTESALTKGVNTIYDGLKSKEEWYSRVLMDHDSHLVILGGTNVNAKVGDQFSIYNELYYWEGDPCNSKYYGGGAATPVATIELDWVGDEVSRGKVVTQTDENPVLGAKVKILKLVPDTAAKTAK